MPLLIVVLGICLLLFLILVLKFNSFLSFVIVSLAVALAEGMTIDKAVVSIENGIGNTMGFLVLDSWFWLNAWQTGFRERGSTEDNIQSLLKLSD